jgi:hypothetical protein
VDDVGEVGPAELLDLLAGRQGPLHVPVVLGEGEDVLDAQALELGHVDDLHVVAGDDGLGPHGEVPQVPDGDGLVAGQVRPDLGGEEAVHLPLALELGGEGGLGDLGELGLVLHAWRKCNR